MQATTIQKMENLLLVAVPADLLDEEVLRLREAVLEEIRRCGSRWVLLDFSRVDICDSFFGRFIQDMSMMVKLVGAEVIVSGLKNAVVVTMVHLGMTLPDVRAVLDIDDALALSRKIDRTMSGSNEQAMDELTAMPSADSLSTDLALANSVLSGLVAGSPSLGPDEVSHDE
jgi:rsbT antagonist protein RsbS